MVNESNENSEELKGGILWDKATSSPNLVRDHIDMAVMFAEKAKSAEDTLIARAEMVEAILDQKVERASDVLNDPVTLQHESRFHATGAVIVSFAFVEAGINEFIHKRINEEGLDIIHKYGGTRVERLRIHEKYELMLALYGRNQFDTGGQIYENFKHVQDLRNILVHHEPEFDLLSANAPQQRMGQIYHKFDENPFYLGSGLFFPYRCMGFGCAKWAIESCLSFTETFYSQVDVSKPYSIPETSFPIDIDRQES